MRRPECGVAFSKSYYFGTEVHKIKVGLLRVSMARVFLGLVDPDVLFVRKRDSICKGIIERSKLLEEG